MSETQLEVCVIGAGPRGLSVLERLCANARERALGTEVVVHLVDPCRPGAGRVWRTDQSHLLLMNTVASQVTLFTDPSVRMAGELAPGPSLYEWARAIALMGDPAGDDTALDDQVLAEARDLTPDAYPTRAFYGHYLRWVFARVVRTAPEHVGIVVHPLRAVRLQERPDGRQCVTLANGTRIDGLDAVVMAQGHVPVHADETQTQLAAFAREHSLTYVPPVNPADIDLSHVAPGEKVALRGLGLAFFDHMVQFTVGRGGTFERTEGAGLVYHPSGREPVLYAGSRRGVPYHSRGANQKGAHGRHEPLLLTPARIAGLRAAAGRGGVDFVRDLWPLIAKEAETVYYTALLTRRSCVCVGRSFRDDSLATGWDTPEETAVLDRYGIAPAERWDWRRIARPYGDQALSDPGQWRSWLLGALRRDVAESALGNVDGPLKSALDVLRDLRNEIRLVIDHGGLTGSSHREHLERWYTPLNAFLSIGPPPSRIEEMTALIESGVLRVLGPGMRVDTDGQAGVFVVDSAEVPGSRAAVTCLVEARLPEPDLRRTTDPLLRHLAATGQCRPFVVADAEHGDHETGGVSVTRRPYHLVAADGRPHPRRFAYGVPTESVHWVTAAGVRPGVDSVTLGDSDAIALALLALAAPAPAPVAPEGSAPPVTPGPRPRQEPARTARQETE
ncbi:FAD/NAD(P)-binding protein [Streptomyces sp. FXJ1.172]|uniref:FAD/NAD(P)-binding protein n=1 Tax=Streptomyces sp. FXJ1.172 TaxID=710705 RepID=UPI00082FF4BC|nr:FAD/NAD(P)-binding protein [Streptomyces sp. FXJ1.172]WEO94216.1 FAD/NAD(P)-binding protein [Streptomyces sp. FXJ1.172]